jgi:hypothetical protein
MMRIDAELEQRIREDEYDPLENRRVKNPNS